MTAGAAGEAVDGAAGSWLLGIDVGNSKTHLVVTDLDGAVVGAATAPGLRGEPLDAVPFLADLLDLVEGACGARRGFASAAFAMAGLDLPRQEAEMARLVAEAHVAARLVVCNDTFALLRTGSPTGEGIAVVAGAGINGVGVRGATSVRYHSLGALSGDWGGGQDVGAAALWAACRSRDGRGPRTALEGGVAGHFGLPGPLDVAEAVYFDHLPLSRLVELAPVVFDAATSGDAVAASIVERLADEVLVMVETTLRRLGAPTDEPTAVLLGGGLLQAGHGLLLERVSARVATWGPAVVLSVAAVPPVVGAVLLAADQVPGAVRDGDLLAQRLRHHLAPAT